MIIDHDKQFVFFRAPKTGSTSIEFCLRMCGGLSPNTIATGIAGIPSINIPAALQSRIDAWASLPRTPPKVMGRNIIDTYTLEDDDSPLPLPRLQHATPAECITLGLLTIEQIRSYNCYAFLRDPYEKSLSAARFTLGSIVGPELFKKFRRDGVNLGIVDRKQIEYFLVDGEEVVSVKWFDDLEAETRSMIAELGGFDFPYIPPLNRSRNPLSSSQKADFLTNDMIMTISSSISDELTFYQNKQLERL